MKPIQLKMISLILGMVILFSLLPVISFAENYNIQLDVPVIPQESDNTCADASARECISYYVQHRFGTTVPSEETLVQTYGIAYASVIENSLSTYCGVSFTTEYVKNPDPPHETLVTKQAFYDILRSSISNGNPVVVNIGVVEQSILAFFRYAQPSPSHYVVVSGLNKYSDNIDDIFVTIKDPWSPYGANHGQTVYVPLLHLYNACMHFIHESSGLIVPVDTTPPTISDVSVYNITSTSYTISLIVTDDGFVREVKMPSWAVGASPPEEWPNAAQNDNSFMYTVTRNPGQHWVTDIYAYDMAGNCTADNQSNVVVFVRDCSVTFNANGGSVSETNRTVYSVLINGNQQNSYGTLPTPTRDGYSFDGWYTELTGGEEITAASKVSDIDSQTLYAKWSQTCEHSYTQLDYVLGKIKMPTLSESGYFTYRCTECGEEIVEYYPALNNTDYAIERVESTCTEAGYDEYTYLGDDAFHLSFTVDLPLAAHQYESVDVPPIAGKQGYTMNICSVCGDSYKEYYSDEWTEWSEAYPSGVDASLIEGKTQYRARTKETTTSSESSLDGWTLYDTRQAWGAYGEWSDWGDVAITPDESTDVDEPRTVYPYYYFYCTNCGLGARYPYSGVRCEICGRNDTVLGSTGTVEWYTNPWSDSIAWGTGTGKYYQYINDSILWNWEDGAPKTQYRSRIREMETTYHFYRWTDWSEWDDQVETETDDKEVETRVVYRYAIIPSEYPEYIVIIPSATSVVEEESFYGINAEYVYVPDSVTEIKSLAFAACPNLKVVYFENGNNITIAENFVSGCDRMLVIDAPDGSSVANNINIYRQYLSE